MLLCNTSTRFYCSCLRELSCTNTCSINARRLWIHLFGYNALIFLLPLYSYTNCFLSNLFMVQPMLKGRSESFKNWKDKRSKEKQPFFIDDSLTDYVWGTSFLVATNWCDVDDVCNYKFTHNILLCDLYHLMIMFLNLHVNCLHLQIYVSINIIDWHWILGRVDIINRRVDTYDSYIKDMSYCKSLEAPWTIILHVLKATNVFDTQSQLDSSVKPFKHGFEKKYPQQQNGSVTMWFILKLC